MNVRISRRSLASYAVSQIEAGVSIAHTLDELAAYLISADRDREADLVIRSIEDEFAAHGTVIARVVTAEPLTDTLRSKIAARIGGKHVHLDEHIDSTVLGGVRIETPDQTFDGTIKRKLLTLRHAKM